MENIDYLEIKNFSYEILLEHFQLNHSFKCGTDDLFGELISPSNVQLLLYFIATATFQIEKNGLEERVKANVTYWEYQYSIGKIKDVILNEDELKQDIDYIKKHVNLNYNSYTCDE